MPQNPSQPFLMLDKQHRTYQGMAYGQRQSTLVVSLRIQPLPTLNFPAIDDHMAEWIIKPYLDSDDTTDATTALLRRIHHWQATIQEEHSIPVFGDCVVDRDSRAGENGQERYRLALSFIHPKASIAALDWILDALNALLQNPAVPAAARGRITRGFTQLKADLRPYAIRGTNMMHFLAAAHDQGMWWHNLNGGTYCIGIGSNSRWLSSSITDKTPNLGVAIAKNKTASAIVLGKYCLPVPKHRLVNSEKNAVAVAQQLGYPVVIKPADKDQGIGVFAGLRGERSLRIAYRAAKEVSSHILVEKHHHGEDYRFTVMADRVIKIMHRKPGQVTGDGQQTVAQLVAQAQASEDHQRALRRTGKMRLQLDAEALELLEDQELTTESIPAINEMVLLRRKSNISSGGSHALIPVEAAHPDNCTLAIRAASILGLDIAGIDLIMPDARESWLTTGAIICEVNAQPQIGYRDTPGIYKDMLRELVPGAGAIPVHLLLTSGQPASQIFEAAQQCADKLGCNAFSTASGIWIDGHQQGWHPENSYRAAHALLLDKGVHCALLALDARDTATFGLPIAEFSTTTVLKAANASAAQQPTPELEQALSLLQAHLQTLNNQRRTAEDSTTSP
ncbi:acetate--CoA ligase family protein [Ramlibacter sp. WS9]|uniref:acetate--CoA ligase family protein n=1 Tax=Ramlibacter sp. WS9 TaxID=1882741 RepID=UPI001141584A|nr:acetate--CoA ligase family protein [Ramlibacter sp. WS9]ROZ66705.1 hypothetical protein EEB15_25545 [Ramlibacter sp. WS9]